MFLDKLNSLHPSLHFTFEKESNCSLPFLNVLFKKLSSGFITSIYRKPTFTGQYIRWNSFRPEKRKIHLFMTLTHCALFICSTNGYNSSWTKLSLSCWLTDTLSISSIRVKSKNLVLPCSTQFWTQKCPVYLCLPWLGSVSTRFKMQVKSAIQHCFTTVKPRVFYTTSQLFSATKKDVLPASKKSNVIYQFSCHCDSRYVGCTFQRLQDRIKQHVQKFICSGGSSQEHVLPAYYCKSSGQSPTQHLACESAIGLHLLQNSTCAQHYDDSSFSILFKGHFLFHVSALEATFLKLLIPFSVGKNNLSTFKNLALTFSLSLAVSSWPITALLLFF